MDFFYPNYINDMWRVMGHVFYGDRMHFVDEAHHSFRLDLIIPFLELKGIALYDTASAVRRLKDNASDKYLEIETPTDIAALVARMPKLQAICTTGQKATETLYENLLATTCDIEMPTMGNNVPFPCADRTLLFYRMPSTSRAYPLSLEKKAAHYTRMFRELEIIPS